MGLLFFLILLVLGIFSGMVAGFLGVGGGIIFTPILFYVFGISGIEDPVAWTIGTSLFCTFTAALSSSIQQRKHKNSFLLEGIKVGLFGAVGVYFGKLIATSDFYTETVFVIFFTILLLFVAVMFYKRGKQLNVITAADDKITVRKSVFTGGFGGFIAALAGVGGGVVVVPVLNLYYKIKLTKAVSVSSLVVLIISLSGWLQFAFLATPQEAATSSWAIGYVDFGTAFPLIIGAFFGGFAGVRLGKLVGRSVTQYGFSVLIIVVAVVMISRII